MGLARFHISFAQMETVELLLSGPEADHAAARRLKNGDQVSLFNGQGGEALALVENWSRKGLSLKITQRFQAQPEAMVRVILIIGLIRGERFRLLVEKAVELGVAEIRPLICKFGQPVKAHKHQKLEKAAVEALKQCGRSFLPQIQKPAELTNILDATGPIKSKMILDREGEPLRLTRLVPERETALLIGPEGGFSDQETNLAKQAGFKAINLSGAVLRTETAALAGLAVIHAWAGQGTD